MTGTAMLFPIALYLSVSGQSSAGFPRYGIFVQSSGNPCKRSHSIGINRRTAISPSFATAGLQLVSSVGKTSDAPTPSPLLEEWAVSQT